MGEVEGIPRACLAWTEYGDAVIESPSPARSCFTASRLLAPTPFRLDRVLLLAGLAFRVRDCCPYGDCREAAGFLRLGDSLPSCGELVPGCGDLGCFARDGAFRFAASGFEPAIGACGELFWEVSGDGVASARPAPSLLACNLRCSSPGSEGVGSSARSATFLEPVKPAVSGSGELFEYVAERSMPSGEDGFGTSSPPGPTPPLATVGLALSTFQSQSWRSSPSRNPGHVGSRPRLSPGGGGTATATGAPAAGDGEAIGWEASLDTSASSSSCTTGLVADSALGLSGEVLEGASCGRTRGTDGTLSVIDGIAGSGVGDDRFEGSAAVSAPPTAVGVCCLPIDGSSGNVSDPSTGGDSDLLSAINSRSSNCRPDGILAPRLRSSSCCQSMIRSRSRRPFNNALQNSRR